MTKPQLISLLCNHGYDQDDLEGCSLSELRIIARDITLDCSEFMGQAIGGRLVDSTSLEDSLDDESEDSDEFE